MAYSHNYGYKIGEKTLTILIAVTLLVGGAVWIVHSELARIDHQVSAIDKRMPGLETAVRILSNTQSKVAVKELVRDTLAVSEKVAPSMEAPAMRMERKVKLESPRIAPKAPQPGGNKP